jgi:hypothetical protein
MGCLTHEIEIMQIAVELAHQPDRLAELFNALGWHFSRHGKIELADELMLSLAAGMEEEGHLFLRTLAAAFALKAEGGEA